MATDYIIEQLKKEFEGRESFSRSELFDFYLRYDWNRTYQCR